MPRRFTSQLLDPAFLAEQFPDIEFLQDPDNFFYQFLSGIASGLLYTLFFSFCPQMFKAIANYEGNVSSIRKAEDKALIYYWYFMLLTAFTGTSLAQMLASGLSNIGEELREYDAKVFEVNIEMLGVDSILRPAMTTSNEIVTDILQEVIAIPLEALYSDSLPYVFALATRSAVSKSLVEVKIEKMLEIHGS